MRPLTLSNPDPLDFPRAHIILGPLAARRARWAGPQKQTRLLATILVRYPDSMFFSREWDMTGRSRRLGRSRCVNSEQRDTDGRVYHNL